MNPAFIVQRLMLAACCTLFIAPGIAQEKSVNPGINDNFKNPELNATEWVERFETEGREVYHHRAEIVAATGVAPGDVVADVGAGTGLFTMLFAQKVGDEGKVLAVDIATPFLAKIHERAASEGVKNVETILCTDRDARIKKQSADIIFICDTYHHFEYPESTVKSLHWGLKDDGILVVVDFEREPGKSSDWIMSHVRAGKETFTKEIEAAGFEKVGEADFLKENYLIKFKKKPERVR